MEQMAPRELVGYTVRLRIQSARAAVPLVRLPKNGMDVKPRVQMYADAKEVMTSGVYGSYVRLVMMVVVMMMISCECANG